jgi:predicted DCC family thiol-disulfide oxidoreductase YuxK
VRWLLRRDVASRLRFAALDGETARDRGLAPSDGRDPESIVVVDGGRMLYRSRAFFAVLAHVRSGWRWLRVFRWLPAWLTDLPYRLVARVRFRIFGRADACSLPEPSQRERFLP